MNIQSSWILSRLADIPMITRTSRVSRHVSLGYMVYLPCTPSMYSDDLHDRSDIYF